MSTTATQTNLVTLEQAQFGVWAIEHDRGLVPPVDDDGVGCFMAFASHTDAAIALESQLNKGYLDTENNPRVVRVK